MSRPRVVDVIGRHIAQGFAVTTAGDLVAIHCYTSKGTIVITGPLTAFNATARADRDANGRPFEAPVRRQELAPRIASAVGDFQNLTEPVPEPAPITAPVQRRPRPMTPERQAVIDAAARLVLAGKATAVRAAAEIGEPVAYIYTAVARLRRTPLLKPNGKIL